MLSAEVPEPGEGGEGQPSWAAQNGGAPVDLGGSGMGAPSEEASLSKSLEVVGLAYQGPGVLQALGLSSPVTAEQSWFP